MIFETDKFEFQNNQTITLYFDNDFIVRIKCRENDCTIEYGFDKTNKTKFSSLEDAESNVVKLIQKFVKQQGAKLTNITRSKKSTNQYKTFMEVFIK